MVKNLKRGGNIRQAARSAMARRALVCELLEGRQLLASDLLGMVCIEQAPVVSTAVIQKTEASEGALHPEATHAYVVDSQTVGMHVHPTRIALSIAEGHSRSALASYGLQFVRGVDTSFDVYEAVDDAANLVTELKVAGIVAESLPVFVRHDSNSEAVLVDELIVSLNPGTDAEKFFAGRDEFSTYRRLDGTPNQYVATLADGVGEQALVILNQLQSEKLAVVEWLEPNFYQNWQKSYIPNDLRFANQWHLHNIGQLGALPDADSDLPEAWDLNQGGSSDYVIGVVDDSIAAHPDLALWVNPGEIAGNGIDDDGNGWVDDINGWNFVSNNNSSGPTTPEDVHGTAVAGVAAAIGDNSVGVAGASYNSRVSSARMFEGFSVANDANIAAALYYMSGRTANGLGTWDSADVVNNSWGGGGVSSAINGALAWGTSQGRMGAGTPIFFASGNGFGSISYPATQAASVPGLFAVGATNSQGTRSNYSNFGVGLNFVTPSNDTRTGYLAIDTTDRVGGDGYDPSDYTGTGANGFGGTSSATPLAVGIAALVMDQADDLGVVLTPGQLESYLHNATDLIGGVEYDVISGKNIEYGFGRLNAATAVAGIGKAEISVLASTGELESGASSVDFGTIYVGQNNGTTFRIRNQGTQPLDLNSLSISSAQFAIASGFSDSSLSVGEVALFTISFSPTSVGTQSGTITIGSNDTDEASFTFDVSGTAEVRSISGYVVEDWDGDGMADPQDTPVSGRIVYLDANENGIRDVAISSFTNNTRVGIVDHTTSTSMVSVAGMSGPVINLNVELNITHTWVGDLDAWLIAPTGERVQLFDRIGGSGDNFIGTVFDDTAVVPISAGTAPFTGRFIPDEPLSMLAGLDANGTWTLEVTDFAGGDIGAIESWTLSFEDGEAAVRTDSDGYYFFDGLAPGTYQVRSLAEPGWAATADNLQVVTLVEPDDFFANVDFGTAADNRFYGLVFDDVNADGVYDSSEVPLGGRQLLIDSNDNGLLDTETVNFLNTTVLPIEDFSTTTSTLEISGVGMPVIGDVNVRLDITHTYNEDLRVLLVHPDGTVIELFNGVGGLGEDFTDTVLDDQGSTSIADGTAPFTGTYRPATPLSLLNGKDANGVWTLRVLDQAAKDFGTLNEWSLEITASEEVLVTDPLGRAARDFSAGTYDLYLVPLDGWVNTIPVDGSRTVEVAGAPIVNQTFGTTVGSAGGIAAAMMAGSTWPSVLLDYVDQGNGYGMELTLGLAPIPFNNLDRLYLQFTEAMQNVSSDTIELRDSNGVVPITVVYDPVAFVAEIQFAALPAGKYRIAASDAITDTAGNALDGDNSGLAGGIFDFRFDVLPGDANGDGRVGTTDLLGFGAAFGAQVGQANYNLLLDWDGNGRINTSDLTVFGPNFNLNLDGFSEPGSPFGNGGGQSTARAGGVFYGDLHDAYFKGLGEDEEDEKDSLI